MPSNIKLLSNKFDPMSGTIDDATLVRVVNTASGEKTISVNDGTNTFTMTLLGKEVLNVIKKSTDTVTASAGVEGYKIAYST